MLFKVDRKQVKWYYNCDLYISIGLLMWSFAIFPTKVLGITELGNLEKTSRHGDSTTSLDSPFQRLTGEAPLFKLTHWDVF